MTSQPTTRPPSTVMDGDRPATSGPTTVVDDGNDGGEMDVDITTGRFRLEQSLAFPTITSVPEHPSIHSFDEDINRLGRRDPPIVPNDGGHAPSGSSSDARGSDRHGNVNGTGEISPSPYHNTYPHDHNHHHHYDSPTSAFPTTPALGGRREQQGEQSHLRSGPSRIHQLSPPHNQHNPTEPTTPSGATQSRTQTQIVRSNTGSSLLVSPRISPPQERREQRRRRRQRLRRFIRDRISPRLPWRLSPGRRWRNVIRSIRNVNDLF